MSAVSSILRWLDGESPGSSSRDDSQVMSSETKADDTANEGARLQSPSDEITIDSAHPDHSSVMAIEADLMEVSSKAVHAVRDWGNYLFSLGKLTSEHVSKTAMQLKSVLEDKMLMADAEEVDDANTNGSELKKTPETAVAPWIGYNEEETMKTQILALSKDKRNFIRPLPASSQFFFDYDVNYPVALVMLNEDPNLKTMRFELVPKHMREETFWRNYFYRVSLIKQSVQLTSLAKCSAESKTEAVTTDEAVKSEFPAPSELAELAVAGDDIEPPFITDDPDIDLTLSSCIYVPADDIQPYEEDAGMDDTDFEFVSVADVVDPGNG